MCQGKQPSENEEFPTAVPQGYSKGGRVSREGQFALEKMQLSSRSQASVLSQEHPSNRHEACFTTTLLYLLSFLEEDWIRLLGAF